MNYEYLKVFYTVCEEKSLTNAAKALYTSQPAISRVISYIESELKIKLFYRTKKGVELTSDGKKLYELLNQPLKALEKIEDDIAFFSSLNEGIIKIGATATSLHCYILDFLDSIKKKHPEVHFTLSTGSTQVLLDNLKKGDIDIAFITTPFEETNDVIIKYIYDIKTILICGSEYKDYAIKQVGINELKSLPFVLPNEDMKFREYINSFMKDLDIDIVPQYEIDSSDMILPLVERNYGFSFIPEDMAKDKLTKNLIFKVNITEELPLRKIAFVTSKSHFKRKVISIIEQAI